jgi:glutaredoxin-related protein
MVFIKGTPTAPRCQFSRQLLEILTAQNIRFSSFNILADDEVRQAMKAFSDWPTFPQVTSLSLPFDSRRTLFLPQVYCHEN